MKNLFFICAFISTYSFAQVGINTNNPLNTLHVEGDARITNIKTLTEKPTYILTHDQDNVISKILTSSLFSDSNLSFSNGLTKTGDNVKLGGTLTEPTKIITSETNTFKIEGLQKGDRNGKFLLLDPTDNSIKQIDISELISSINVPITVLNASTKTTRSLPGNRTQSIVNYETVSIGPDPSWSNNQFTAAKSGVYTIHTGALFGNLTNNTTANLAIVAGGYVQSAGGILLTNDRYSTTNNFVVHLNAGDKIYTQTNSGKTSNYTQTNGFLNITYSGQ